MMNTLAYGRLAGGSVYLHMQDFIITVRLSLSMSTNGRANIYPNIDQHTPEEEYFELFDIHNSLRIRLT